MKKLLLLILLLPFLGFSQQTLSLKYMNLDSIIGGKNYASQTKKLYIRDTLVFKDGTKIYKNFVTQDSVLEIVKGFTLNRGATFESAVRGKCGQGWISATNVTGDTTDVCWFTFVKTGKPKIVTQNGNNNFDTAVVDNKIQISDTLWIGSYNGKFKLRNQKNTRRIFTIHYEYKL